MLTLVVVPPLLLGFLLGLGVGDVLLWLVSRDSYEPQTVYFLAAALAVLLSQRLQIDD